MQKLILICFLILTSLTLAAQETGNGKITGNVVDSISGVAVEYASITLFVNGNKKELSGAATDKAGHFVLSGINEGSYAILVGFIGYRPYLINNVEISNNKLLADLKIIHLTKSQTTLQNVTVTTPKGLIENKIDKIVFNAEKDITSQSGVATDVLKKIPQVSVDVDGNVQLSGSASIRFLINGKPSSAFGSSITDVLQSIPASQIKSIEVITNPGAKYDAQGLGGIINIILKQNKTRGINGNLSLTAGTRMENGSFNLNARKDNFGMNAFVSGNERLNATTPSVSDRLSVDTGPNTNTLLHQQGAVRFKRHGYQSGVGFDWTYKKKNNFSGSFNYNNFGNSGIGLINQLQIKTAAVSGNILSNIASVNHTENKFVFRNTDVSLNYKRTFDKEDQELEISFNSSIENNRGTLANYQLLLPIDSVFYGTSSNNPGKENETEIKLDYTQPLKKDIILGVGGKAFINNINSTSNVYSLQPDTKTYLFDNNLSNYLTYHQKVYALYGEISFPISHLFEAKIGGRYERTNINSFYSNAQQQANAHGYNTFVPSIFLSKKITDNQTIKLSYSKRIERPDYGDLNPFINTSDPKNISAGNPFLLPEIGHRFELSYSCNYEKAGSFMVTAFYRINEHDIQPYIVYYPSFKVGDSTYYNVAVGTRQNIGTENNAGVNLFVDLHATSKLSIRSNLFFFHRHTINALDPGFNSNSFNYRLNMNVSYQFSNTLAGEFFGNFNSARHEAQGRYPSFTSYSIALRKQFWNKKGSLALSAINPFGKYVNQQTAIFGNSFSVNSLRQIPFRSIAINFTWKFGKLEFKKEKEENNVNLNPSVE